MLYAVLGLGPLPVGLVILLLAGDTSHLGEIGLAAGVGALCIACLVGASAIQRRASNDAAAAPEGRARSEGDHGASPVGKGYRRIYNVCAFTLFGAVSLVALLVLLLRHHEIGTALVLSTAWGAVSQGLTWGVLGAAAPEALIRWRQALMMGNTGAMKDLGDYFSRWLGAEGPRPWENPTALRRVRRQGFIGLVVWGAVTISLLLLVAPLDHLWRAIRSQ